MTDQTDAVVTTRTGRVKDLRHVWERYGGGDVPATLAGLLAAVGTLVLLLGLIAAGAGNIAVQVDTIDVEGNLVELSAAGAVTAVLVLVASFFVGGWVAARMARFDGPKNGLIVALWMLALVVLFGALGAWAGSEYNVFAQMELPDWASQWDADELSTAAAIAASAGSLSMFLGGYLGGLVGEAYNRKVDAAIVNAPETRLTDREEINPTV